MYAFIVIALMLVVPLICIVAQVLSQHGEITSALALPIIAKWYVFWAIGVRLSLAGLRQIFQPRYTAETILGVKSADSLFLVRELGFANAAMGSAAMGSLLAPSWGCPAGFDGRHHAQQNLALISDLFAAAILAFCCFA